MSAVTPSTVIARIRPVPRVRLRNSASAFFASSMLRPFGPRVTLTAKRVTLVGMSDLRDQDFAKLLRLIRVEGDVLVAPVVRIVEDGRAVFLDLDLRAATVLAAHENDSFGSHGLLLQAPRDARTR